MTDILKDEFERYLENLDDLSKIECECGAKYTSNPKWHYEWCARKGIEE